MYSRSSRFTRSPVDPSTTYPVIPARFHFSMFSARPCASIVSSGLNGVVIGSRMPLRDWWAEAFVSRDVDFTDAIIVSHREASNFQFGLSIDRKSTRLNSSHGYI